MDQQRKTKLSSPHNFFFKFFMFIEQFHRKCLNSISIIKAVKRNDLSQDVDIRHELLNRFKHTGKLKPPVIKAGK